MSDLKKKLREKLLSTWRKMRDEEMKAGMDKVKNMRKNAQSTLTRETDGRKGEDSRNFLTETQIE